MKQIKKYTINDIAGYEEEKKELQKIIDLFNNYDKYKSKGAYMSKGLILSGEPGVGKTLFAKVLASEINAPLINLDGSTLGGIFGALRIKKAFKKASKNSPSMIFIDEINMLAGDDGYYSDFTQRNLSCLLKLMDGIDEHNDIFVVGASSNKDDLDEALLRSGRMDKHICISLPNNKSRKEIFNLYLNGNDLIKKVDLDKAVGMTSGMTGADIKTIVNEAALEAIKNNDGVILDEQIQTAIFKIKNKDLYRETEVSKTLLYHDIGHLIVSYKLFNKFDDIYVDDMAYVGNSSISYLENMNRDIENDYDDEDYDDYDDEDYDDYEDNNFLVTKKNAIDLIAVYLAGSICEELIFEDKGFAGYKDIYDATSDLYYMMGAGYFGFKYTFVNDLSETKPLVGKFRELVEEEKIRIFDLASEKATKIIKDNIDVIKRIYEIYEEVEQIRKENIGFILKDIK